MSDTPVRQPHQQKIAELIDGLGVTGYKQCTIPEIARRLELDEIVVTKALQKLERDNKVFSLKVEARDCYVLRADPSKTIALP